MRFNPKTVTVASDGGLRHLFAWLDWMRTSSPGGPGWTVVQSSDGTNYTGDGGSGLPDNIDSFGDLSQYVASTSISWFVLESPDGAIQFCFGRFNTADTDWRIYLSTDASFTGGTAGLIPSPATGYHLNMFWGRLNNNYASVLHMGADDAAPYGFWHYAHDEGNFAATHGFWAWCPVEATQAGDELPYVWMVGEMNYGGAMTAAYLAQENPYNRTHCAALLPGEVNSQTTPAMTYENSGGLFAPNQCEVDADGDDLSFPIPFGRRVAASSPVGFKGISTFIQWNGRSRAAGETFASKTRVSWGDVNFPWDGSTPEVS